MARVESLDELISRKAAEFADQIKAAAAMADKEEEIRIEVEKQLAFLQKEAGIKLEGKHEFTVASGRVDSVYSRVIIEYKNPASPSARIGPKADSSGSKKVIEQIKKRFYDMRAQHHQPLNTLFGVGLDGKHFIFVRFRDDKWDVQEPVEVNQISATRFLWALFNLGHKGRSFSPEYLAGDFGSAENSVAMTGIRALYQAITTTDHPKAQTFFNQWKILFGEVCGYDVDSPSDKIKKLADFYGVAIKGVKPAEMLFAVHTYYAIFMKLLASEIVTFFHARDLPTPLKRMMSAVTSNKLKREMEELEAGSIFRHFNITNFLEGDLFAWYTSVWSEPIEQLIRNMVMRLDNYNPGTFSEDPVGSRDLLKKLYQQLFPKSVRHDLGEYYTPDWLAEHVLNELEYVGDPDKRLLDPACGSGTFLVMAINRIRAWYDKNREQCWFDEGDLCRKILSNVIGFDLNPLAVMAARTNYLIAIRGLISHVGKVEIPVYLCDSILTPSEYGGLFGLGKTKELKTAATTFLIPTEITNNREEVAKYAEQLEFCISSGYSPKQFIERCHDEGLPINEDALHTELYKELVKLDKANKNGVWARIIKNAFAPLFVGQVDYIAGNPPWVNWESLPDEYRQTTAPLWQKYDLFRHKGYKAKLGGGKDDISILLTYVAHDCYLVEGGRLGFVITQSVFKTKGGGEGFRTFEYKSGTKKYYLPPKSVHDLSDFQPFEGATNRTAVFIAAKSSKPFKYPVPYIVWEKQQKGAIPQDLPLAEVEARTHRRMAAAEPVDLTQPTSPWLTAPKKALPGIKKVIGRSDYQANAGSCTWLNGVYWVRILERLRDGKLFIENLHDVGKINVEHVHASVEPDLVYPLLRGRDVSRWKAEPSAHIILANRTDKLGGIPEAEMKRHYPKTFAYLRQFEEQLRWRSGFKRYFKPTDPFYSMYNVGPYTMANWKVLWPEVGHTVRAGVCGPGKVETDKPALPDHTIVAVSCQSKREAHFICALLNSAPAQLAIRGYIVLHPSPHILEHIAVPKYKASDKTHNTLAKLSERCHAATAKDDEETVSELEAEIDELAASLWGITKGELNAIQQALKEMHGSSHNPGPGADDCEDEEAFE